MTIHIVFADVEVYTALNL